jgi:hypothetical protein
MKSWCGAVQFFASYERIEKQRTPLEHEIYVKPGIVEGIVTRHGPADILVRAMCWCDSASTMLMPRPPLAWASSRPTPLSDTDNRQPAPSTSYLATISTPGLGGERMLKGVDHELGGNEPEAHRLAGFHGAGRGLQEERMQAAVINHRVSKAFAQLRQIGPTSMRFITTQTQARSQPRQSLLLLSGKSGDQLASSFQ